MAEDDPPTQGGKIVKLVLDEDAAGLLPELAGSTRKQGEYVSRLIREAAVRQPGGLSELGNLRLRVQSLAGQVQGLASAVDNLRSTVEPRAYEIDPVTVGSEQYNGVLVTADGNMLGHVFTTTATKYTYVHVPSGVLEELPRAPEGWRARIRHEVGLQKGP